MSITEVTTSRAPAPTGAYSQAVLVDGWCYVSGQVGWNADRTGLGDRSAAEQALQAMENISQLLAEVGMTLINVVKTTIYLADFNTFKAVNEAYEERMKLEGVEIFPARTTIGANIRVAVEIDVVARVSQAPRA